MPEYVFKVAYICHNCNHPFKERYGKGIEVRREGQTSIVVGNKVGAEISCPNCDLKRIIIAGGQGIK